MTRNTTLVVLLAAALATTTFAAPVAGTGGSITANPNEANTQSTHTATASVGADLSDSSLTGLDIDYQSTGQNGDISNVGESDIEEMYIDRADGGTRDVSDDVSGVGSSNNGETLAVRLGGEYSLAEGDHVVVTYSGVDNPDAGEYEIVFDVNPQSDGTRSSGTLSIVENGSSTTPTDDGETPTETDDGPTPTPTFADEDTPTRDDDERGGDGGDDGGDGGNDEGDERRESGDDSDDEDADNGTATDRGADSSNGSDGGSGTDGNTNDGDIARSNDADGGGDDGTESDGAGFGIALAAAALLGAALLVRR